MKSSILIAAATTSCAHAFAPAQNSRTSMALRDGLFDGVKEAFGADGMGDLGDARETPIDRWMGWNAKSKGTPQVAVGSQEPTDFIDSMDAKNYITSSLAKPMGIVFEENDTEFGGIFVLEISEGSSAEVDGTVRPGDQLVSVGQSKVSGMQFEEALGKIIDSSESEIDLVLFRGPAKFLYGPAGASQDWLDEFIKGSKVAAN
mmetsp:Transcript_9725/g.17548  ORF Transcript_9725/g.17548 Transcript_9725/m.17548 type:complete len:203 (-) Transcript_9725:179-787(-)|eukprot:CAMPEP_0201608980 /NCGR_PEP_ID=MMETSP0492-20130828/10095_1 /ASSEMBLY_ACC=CAM_ASM_000837 /TAXON_ID=420259 /ORGANISM="Thalassiosira gravida, Strain GMp14c1" /LENGTH=202 /DNA_ID=CAMNT_0048074083 /DNA_START=100 /DNA_END=708 /DNA_ORIENTATION=-